jgi:hypothetical protein
MSVYRPKAVNILVRPLSPRLAKLGHSDFLKDSNNLMAMAARD